MKLKYKNTIIIITGGPGTGKSYAAERIYKAFPQLELLSYDEIKEKEWDRFGFDNMEQKDRVNRFALEEFYLTLQNMMRHKKSILIEYPFHQQHRKQLAEFIDAYNYHAITLLLYGDWKTIYGRGLTRNKTDNRHPGHLTSSYHRETDMSPQNIIPDALLTYEEFRSDIDRKNYDIRLGTTLSLDVTDFSKTDFEKVFRQIADMDS